MGFFAFCWMALISALLFFRPGVDLCVFSIYSVWISLLLVGWH